jgi:membrane protease YdiL (CAAX protease family)
VSDLPRPYHEPPVSPAFGKPVAARPVPQVQVPAERAVSPLELPSLTRAAAALDVGLVVLVALVVPLGLRLAMRLWTSGPAGQAPFDPAQAGRVLTVQKWFDAALAAGLMAYFLLRHRLAPAGFGLRLDHLWRQLAWALGTLLGCYAWILATAVIVTFVVLLFPQAEQDLTKRLRLVDILPTGSLGGMLVLLVPVALHEEIVFRGLLLPYLRRLLGGWGRAVLISSAVFAILHVDQGWFGVLQVFGVAVVWATFFLASRSLLPVTLAHLGFDLIQMHLMQLVPQELRSLPGGLN